MKKLALRVVNTRPAFLVVAAAIVLILGTLESVEAADFFCPSGNVTCLIAHINVANGLPGEHIINLKPGIYTLQAVASPGSGLPMITSSIRIQSSADEPPTVIERDPAAPQFRIFDVSIGGKLSLEGLTVQRGAGVSGVAIRNAGVTSLLDTIVTDSHGLSRGAIENSGTLNVIRSIIADNGAPFEGGGIFNDTGGHVLVENSTIAHNGSQGGGGIWNEGSVVIRNSAIIFNGTNAGSPGGGILNPSGSIEIVNSTIAKNVAGASGEGIYNCCGGLVSITNSTILENESIGFAGGGGGIKNESGIGFGGVGVGGSVLVQNTIIAGNSDVGLFMTAPDCSGTITSLGNNLAGDQTNCDINLQPSDLTGDPGLGALVGAGEDDLPGKAFYPVLAGSPVIDRGNPTACLQTDQLGNFRVGVCDIGSVEFREPALVFVDVRPKKDANRINPNSTKVINVAIFTVNGFDATAVDSSTVRFGATGTEAAPVHVALRDIDQDGHRDMILRFQIQDTGIKCGDAWAHLTAQTSGGLSIEGSTPIKTVQCKQPKVSRN